MCVEVMKMCVNVMKMCRQNLKSWLPSFNHFHYKTLLKASEYDCRGMAI